MAWHFTDDVEEYASRAWPLLCADPVRHTVALTVIESSRARGRSLESPDLFGWWEAEGGTVEGAISHIPPFPMLLAVVPPDAMRPLVHAVRNLPTPVDAVDGDVSDSAYYAAISISDFGGTAQLRHMMRLHRLDELTAPAALPAGAPRPATMDDRPLLLAWFDAFAREAGAPTSPRTIDDRLNFGSLTLWCDPAGEPRAVAGRPRIAAGVARIGPVYTRPGNRNCGLGSAVTHAAANEALAAGAADVVLFTDVANPTSNAIYQRLGFRAVSSTASLQFAD
jgi:ribosomal protein S18 acetylase RimI-like enzyme